MPRKNVSRRSVARGAAWSLPTIAVGVGAPASAASGDPQASVMDLCYKFWQASSGGGAQITAVNGQEVTFTYNTGMIAFGDIITDPTLANQYLITPLSPSMSILFDGLDPIAVTGVAASFDPGAPVAADTPSSMTFTGTFTLPEGTTATTGPMCTSITGPNAFSSLNTATADPDPISQTYKFDAYQDGKLVQTLYANTQTNNQYSWDQVFYAQFSCDPDWGGSSVNLRCGSIS